MPFTVEQAASKGAETRYGSDLSSKEALMPGLTFLGRRVFICRSIIWE